MGHFHDSSGISGAGLDTSATPLLDDDSSIEGEQHKHQRHYAYVIVCAHVCELILLRVCMCMCVCVCELHCLFVCLFD